MGHGNEIGRIGRREAPVDPRGELPSAPAENGGVVPPGKVEVPVEPKPSLPELQDGYLPQPLADVAAPLHGEGAPVTKGVWDIVPDLAKMNELGLIPQRFAADIVLLRAQLSVPGIPLPEQADRLFQFYVAYAQRFVEMANAVEADAGAMNEGEPGAKDQGKADGGQPGRKSGEVDLRPMASLWGENVSVEELVEPPPAPPRTYSKEEKATEVRRFTRAHQDAGFSEFKDPATGKDGTRVAAELLLAQSPAEVRARADQVHLRAAQPQPAPPQTQAQQQAQLPVHARVTVELPVARGADLARTADPARLGLEGRPELRMVDGGALRVQPLAVPVSQALSPSETRTDAPDEPFLHRLANTSKRLGPRMFWNVLHTFRGEGEDASVFQDKWDKLTFGAILLLVGVALAVIVLVSL
jgi:hypothetical protein